MPPGGLGPARGCPGRSSRQCRSPPGSCRPARQGQGTAPAAACSAEHSPVGPSRLPPCPEGAAPRKGLSPAPRSPPGASGTQAAVPGEGGSPRKFGEYHILQGGRRETSPVKKKTTKPTRGPGGSCPPPRAVPPNLPARAPRGRAATGTSLPAGVTSAAACPAPVLPPLLLPPPPPLSLSLLLGALYGDSFIHAFPSVPQRFPASRRQSV